MPRPSIGFVYVLTNPSFPEVVKIGYTSRIVEDRVRDMSTAVPEDFQVAYRIVTMNPHQVEQEAHETLELLRVSARKEYFRTSWQDAREVIDMAVQSVNGLHQWTATVMRKSHPFYLKNSTRIVLPLEADQWFVRLRYPDFTSLATRRPEILASWRVAADGDALAMIGTRNRNHVASFSENDPDGIIDPIPYLDRKREAPNGSITGLEYLSAGERLLWIAHATGSDAWLSVMFEARTYCQVATRTWAPDPGPDRHLQLFTDDADEMPPAVVNCVRRAIRFPPPRHWEPPRDDEEQKHGPKAPGLTEDQWLNKLINRDQDRRRKKRSV